ncbi:MAG: hypothetical protein FWD35_06655 [Oscillospiraceae bacterium]|nr:hypothetical protein [Oscillospiraceae bacterium]
MTNIDPFKIRKDIEDLQGKKDLLTLALRTDIAALEGEIQEQFCVIGEKAYELTAEKAETAKIDVLKELAEEFEKVDALKATQGAKESKRAEIAARYDEEIEILENLLPEVMPAPEPSVELSVQSDTETGVITETHTFALPSMPPQAPNAEQESQITQVTELESGFCPNCRRPYMVGEDQYCQGCGTRLTLA